MARFWSVFVVLVFSACARADVGTIFESYLWEKRVMVVFSPSDDDPQYKEQLQLYAQMQNTLAERDFVVWFLVANRLVVVDGEAKPHLFTRPFYEYFKVDESRFGVIILGKDGEEKLRGHTPVDANELAGLVDAMPMRQQEMRQ